MTAQPRTPRLLAALTIASMATWGTLHGTALADPGQGQGQAQGQAQGQGHAHSQAAQGQGKDKGKDEGKGHAHGQNGTAPGQNGTAPGQVADPPGNAYGHATAPGQAAQTETGATGTPGEAGAGDPAGNNGTVKITPVGEDDGIPQNSPHAVCGVDIEWYGFDEGADVVSTVTFTPQAPTADVVIGGTEPSQVFVGGDPATGAGTPTGFDGEATYRLTFTGEPHPKQGYHVKLTVHTPRSQGADVKHKVFWFEPCGTTPALAPAGATAGETAQGTAPETAGDEPGAGVLGITATADDAQPADAAAGADVPTAVAAGADAGTDGLVDGVLTPWALMGLALALLGAGALVYRRFA